MALRALIAKKKLSEKTKQLEEVRAKLKDLETRETELETAIDEAETEEDKAVVNEAVETYEAEKAEAEKAEADLKREVEELENELKETSTETVEERETDPVKKVRKKETKIMQKRFKDMTHEERAAFVQCDEMQAFLGEVRTAIREKRSISNAGYLVPQVMLGLIKENITDYSKLYNRVDLRQIGGTGRMVIEGTIPEAVWTETCANLNELDLSFSKVEVDGYKVGGYFKVCNATLEDSDVDLASELISALGQAIGLALDKAIIFGTGTKMPTGIIPTLKAVASTPNVFSHANTVKDIALVRALIDDMAAAKNNYSRGDKTWVMNEKTYSYLLGQLVAVDQSGAYVSAINGKMPVIGGDIVVLNFMPDYVICAGYMDLYLLAERAGTTIGTSEHAFWTADMTGFKGTARYDGKVLDANAFVAIGVNGADASDMTTTFAQDSANL